MKGARRRRHAPMGNLYIAKARLATLDRRDLIEVNALKESASIWEEWKEALGNVKLSALRKVLTSLLFQQQGG